jgi:hypothetical protein
MENFINKIFIFISMSNFFEDVVNDLDKVESEFLGPNYDYWKWISPPDEMGMSADGNLGAVGNDIIGLIKYMETLIAGGGAQRGPGENDPLGDRYFLKTGATCKDVTTGEDVTRSIFINNIPTGDIPFLSSAMGTDFDNVVGIVPGVMSSVANINPLQIFQAFMAGTDPSCASVSLSVRDSSNNVTLDSGHLTFTDITNIEPCLWKDATNPISGQTRTKCASLTFQNGTCQGCSEEGFQNADLPNQTDNKLYLDYCSNKINIILQTATVILASYILFKFLYKKNK